MNKHLHSDSPAGGWCDLGCQSVCAPKLLKTCAQGRTDRPSILWQHTHELRVTRGCGFRVGMLADTGTTYNSSITFQHLVQHNPDVRTPHHPSPR